MDSSDRRSFDLRVRLLSLLVVAAFAGVAVRAFVLQVRRHAELKKLATEEYLNDIRIPARRGNIFDRQGRPLAISIDVPSIYANPTSITDPRRAARQLAAVLDLPIDTLYRRLATERLFVWLRRQVTPDIADQVLRLGIHGIGITKEPKRFYPNREVGAHAVGFTGVDGQGLEGVEKVFDEVLAGSPQVVETVKDGHGRDVLETDPGGGSRGADLYLTLDLQLQHAAQATLATAVHTYRAASAMAVVLDAQTAAILTLAVEPAFNPNALEEAEASQWRNRAVTDMFEPGSSGKPLVIAAALNDGIVNPRTTIFCENGSYTVGGRVIHDPHPNGWLDLTGIIKYSSNIGAAKVGEQLGATRLHDTLAALGFGRRSGLVFPGENPGVLHDVATWSTVSTANAAFGHGFAVTALQLAAAYGTLAAGGLYREPHLVKSIVYPDGRTSQPSASPSRRIFSAATVKSVVAMMEQVVQEGGTGLRAQVPGYPVAGKTGTAQKADLVAGGYSADRFVADFAGFLPANEPRAVIIVVVDEPQVMHSGANVAAPIFAEIAAAAMQALGVTPTINSDIKPGPAPSAILSDEAAELQAIEPVVVSPGAVPSFMGLTAREAVTRFAGIDAQLQLEVSGTGRVTKQDPAPNTPTSEARVLRLQLAQGNVP